MRKRLINDMGRLKLDDLIEVLADLTERIESLENAKEVAGVETVVEPVKVDGDVNGDGIVDEEDLSVVHKAYSKEVKKRKPKKKSE